MRDSQFSLGMIHPDVLYTLPALKAQAGIKDNWLRTARSRGLQVHYLQGRGFILGKDFIHFVLSDGQPGDSSTNQVGP